MILGWSEPRVRQGLCPILKPPSRRIEQWPIFPQHRITRKRQSQSVTLENGFPDSLFAPFFLPFRRGNCPFPQVLFRFQPGGDKGCRPGAELLDCCRLQGAWPCRGAAQRLTSQCSQQNCLDDFASIPLWITAEELRVDSRGHQGIAPGSEGDARCMAKPAIITMHDAVAQRSSSAAQLTQTDDDLGFVPFPPPFDLGYVNACRPQGTAP